jgi:hypothetical protein
VYDLLRNFTEASTEKARASIYNAAYEFKRDCNVLLFIKKLCEVTVGVVECFTCVRA